MSNLFRAGWKLKKCWLYLLYADIISFFVTKKFEKKTTKNWWKLLIHREGNLHIFWMTWEISMKFSGKMWHDNTMIILKVKKTRTSHSLSRKFSLYFLKKHSRGQIDPLTPAFQVLSKIKDKSMTHYNMMVLLLYCFHRIYECRKNFAKKTIQKYFLLMTIKITKR